MIFIINHGKIKRKKTKFFQKHGFVHANQAFKNSQKIFPNIMNKKIESIIQRHMFSLNIKPPVSKEGWIVTLVDKYVSFEILKEPKNLHKYIFFISKKDKNN